MGRDDPGHPIREKATHADETAETRDAVTAPPGRALGAAAYRSRPGAVYDHPHLCARLGGPDDTDHNGAAERRRRGRRHRGENRWHSPCLSVDGCWWK